MSTIQALTFDVERDGWERSRGFVKRAVSMPSLDEKAFPADAARVVVKMRYAGLCGSDRGIWNRVAFKDALHASLEREGKTTRILGHEFTGEVVGAGSLVHALYGVKVGDQVSGDSHVTCGTCFQCRAGESHVCADDKILGISLDGVFAPYVKLPAKNLWVVDPNRVRPEIAAMYDPFGNAVHATTTVDVRGRDVAVFGCGPIGMFAVLLLRAFGAAKIIAVDIHERNVETAKALGAHETIHLNTKPEAASVAADAAAARRIMELTGGRGVDVSMEMAGPNSSLVNCLESTRRGGHVVLFGLKDGDFVIPKFSRVVTRGLTLHAVIGRRIFATWQIAERMLGDHTNGIQEKMWKVILKGGTDTIMPFDAYAPEACEYAMNAHPKILFRFS